jgi:uncharacterized protein YggT (Ycf19 family)
LIGGLLALYLLNSYVYLGNHAFWSFVTATGRRVLTPVRQVRLRVGKVDFAPVVMIAVIFLAAELVGRGLTRLWPL